MTFETILNEIFGVYKIPFIFLECADTSESFCGNFVLQLKQSLMNVILQQNSLFLNAIS